MGPRLEERVVYRLIRAEHELRVVLDNALRDLGMTLTQWTVLTFLINEPGLSAADLARRSFISQQGVAGILKRLEQAGLVTRVPHPTHGRIIEVTVTAAGRALAEYGDEQIDALESAVAAELGTNDQAALTASLDRCRAAFRAYATLGEGRIPTDLVLE